MACRWLLAVTFESLADFTRFLLAQLHLNSLKGKRAPTAIRDALKKLPTGSEAYDRAYSDAMERIEGQLSDQEELAKEALSWITCAKRPLTTLELQHALAVKVGEAEFDEGNIPDIEDIISVCTGLVTVDEESEIIRLVHYTTQEYFERTQKKWFPTAEFDITAICVTYLSFTVFGEGFCHTDSRFEERLSLNPLYDYTAHYWGQHARQASSLHPKVLEFLHCTTKREAAAQALLARKMYSSQSNYSQAVPKQITGLHLAAYFGITELVTAFLQSADIDSKDDFDRTPLSWAAERGHEAVVRLLVDTGKADIDSKNSEHGQTPLSWAALRGHEAVVRLLVDTGKADIDSKDNSGRTPLSWAAREGHEAVVRLLVDTGKADIDSKDSEYDQTPLSWAARGGHEAVVRLLVDTGKADIDLKDSDYGQTPLSWAAEGGHEAVVRLLVDTGKADIDSKSDSGRTPLSWAAMGGHEAVVRLLMDMGKADIDSKDNSGRTPLSWAARGGHEAVVRLLVDTGKANIDSKDNSGHTPLSWAALRGHEAVVRLLVDTGKADIDSKDEYGQTPLSWAVSGGHEAVVRLLEPFSSS
jgi:ankyrin repeat protein